jgi:predicted amidohydrolase YtcJ
MRVSFAALLLASAVSITTIVPGPALADTLVDNVNGITLDAKGAVARFTGLLIGDDGRVEQVFERGDKRPAKVDDKLYGKGRVMMAGMIDSLAHVMALGLSTLTIDLSGAKSLAEAQARISAGVAAHPDKPWVLGFGWNEEQWGLGRFPTATELDAAVSHRPAWLMRTDGHAGWANTAALSAAGITATTKDPAGGRIERLAGGKPSGVLIDAATPLVERKVTPARPQDRDLAFLAAQELLLKRGVTAVADMGTTVEDWQTFRRAGDSGALRMRIMAYADGVDAMVFIAGTAPTPWLYNDRLRLNGVKLSIDGALGSRGAALKAPYADSPGNTGLVLIEETRLRNLMSRAAMDNFQVAVHAIGDRANATALDAVDELAASYKGDRRWRIEHAQVIDPVDMPRFGQHGIIASMQPGHQPADRLMAEARLGPARLAGAYAWKSVAATGARLAFGSDGPVEVPDPFAGMATAMTRQGADGQPFGGWQPQEIISREAALAAYTVGGAYAGFADGRFGRLAKGERADFIFVDQDPLLATAAQLRQVKVLQSWVGGQLVHKAD